MFVSARVRAMNDLARSNGASVYREPPTCIVVIKLLMNSLMRLGLTKRTVTVNNAGTTPTPSRVTCTDSKQSSEFGMDAAVLSPFDDSRHCWEVKAVSVTRRCEIWLRQEAGAQLHSEV